MTTEIVAEVKRNEDADDLIINLVKSGKVQNVKKVVKGDDTPEGYTVESVSAPQILLD